MLYDWEIMPPEDVEILALSDISFTVLVFLA